MTELLKYGAAPLAALLAAIFGILQYRHSKMQEFRKRYWEAQFELYSRTLEAASSIAMARNPDSVRTSREEFWKLYWGVLSIVEPQAVEQAMEDFGKKLAHWEENFNDVPVRGDAETPLQLSVLKLADEMRNSLKLTWQPVAIGELKGRRRPFRSGE